MSIIQNIGVNFGKTALATALVAGGAAATAAILGPAIVPVAASGAAVYGAIQGFSACVLTFACGTNYFKQNKTTTDKIIFICASILAIGFACKASSACLGIALSIKTAVILTVFPTIAIVGGAAAVLVTAGVISFVVVNCRALARR